MPRSMICLFYRLLLPCLRPAVDFSEKGFEEWKKRSHANFFFWGTGREPHLGIVLVPGIIPRLKTYISGLGLTLKVLFKFFFKIFEKPILFLPVRAKSFVEIASEFIKEFLPDWLASTQNHVLKK